MKTVAIDYNASLKSKYEYLSEKDVDLLFETAKNILYNLMYPFDMEGGYEAFEVPKSKENWVYRAAVELMERSGISSVIGYRENKWQATFDRAQLSNALVSEIVPFGGVPK
jgi:hypothetical protein